MFNPPEEKSYSYLDQLLALGLSKDVALKVIAIFNSFSTEKMAKWIRNSKKLYKTKAEDIYNLIRELKKKENNITIIDLELIEKKILELTVI